MIDSNQIERRARAEVLAAYENLRQEVNLFLDTLGAMPQVEFVADRRTWTAKQYKTLIRLNNYVHQLQPAGSELEELLRKERDKGLKLANLIYKSDGNFLLTDRGTHEGRMESYDVWNRIFAEAINIRAHEKEKARAILEKG